MASGNCCYWGLPQFTQARLSNHTLLPSVSLTLVTAGGRVSSDLVQGEEEARSIHGRHLGYAYASGSASPEPGIIFINSWTVYLGSVVRFDAFYKYFVVF
ncbi:hypothetical protein E2C01_092297 [Portunus trituberculatus]|uniref:Uncharacterized protein n=1 Tax=Portunus trituberculatus TaxID=210409 RepID=A0A5B7JJQ9_PORTR|nr:hypothetical protein [Portunus trituberculatus]